MIGMKVHPIIKNLTKFCSFLYYFISKITNIFRECSFTIIIEKVFDDMNPKPSNLKLNLLPLLRIQQSSLTNMKFMDQSNNMAHTKNTKEYKLNKVNYEIWLKLFLETFLLSSADSLI